MIIHRYSRYTWCFRSIIKSAYSRVHAFSTHMPRCGYVEFHYAAQFDITCLSRVQSGFMATISGEDVRFRDGPSLHSSSLRVRRRKSGTIASLFVSSIDDQRRWRKLFCVQTFVGRNGFLDDEPGILMKLNIEEDPPLIRPIALRVMLQRGTAPKINAIAFWCELLFVWTFVKKFDQERRSKFSSGNLIREFV